MTSDDPGRIATPLLPKNVWKAYFVLTVNALDDDVALWQVKARSQQEAYEKANAGSHNLDTNLIFDEKGFSELVHEVDRMRARIEAQEEAKMKQKKPDKNLKEMDEELARQAVSEIFMICQKCNDEPCDCDGEPQTIGELKLGKEQEKK